MERTVNTEAFLLQEFLGTEKKHFIIKPEHLLKSAHVKKCVFLCPPLHKKTSYC